MLTVAVPAHSCAAMSRPKKASDISATVRAGASPALAISKLVVGMQAVVLNAFVVKVSDPKEVGAHVVTNVELVDGSGL